MLKKIRYLLLVMTAASLAACSSPAPPPTERSPDPGPQNALQGGAVFVVNGGDSTLSVLDTQGTQVLGTLKLPAASFPHHAYLSPDGQTLAVSLPGVDFSAGHGGGHAGHNMPGRFALVDARTGEVKTVKTTSSVHHNAVFSPDGREIWAAAMAPQGPLLIYDAATLNVIREITVGSLPAEVTFSADGKRAFVANGGSSSVSAIDRASKTVAGTVTVGANPVGAWPGSDNRLYVDNEESKTLSVLNAETLQIEQTLELGFMPGMAALHNNQRDLWISDAENGKVVIFSRSSATGPLSRARELATGANSHAIAFSKDGLTAFVSNQGAGTVSVIDTATLSKRRDLKVGAKPNGLAIR